MGFVLWERSFVGFASQSAYYTDRLYHGMESNIMRQIWAHHTGKVGSRAKQGLDRVKMDAINVRAMHTHTPQMQASIPSSTVQVAAVSTATNGSHHGLAKLKDYIQLSKFRLSALVTFTAGVGYAMRCNIIDRERVQGLGVHERAAMGSLYHRMVCFYDTARAEITTVSGVLLGTFLASSCANTLNQMYEVHSDAKMARTRLRPLPANRLPMRNAAGFAMATGLSSLALLQYFGGEACASLGMANIFLYAAIYTPLKAIHPINTPVGAIVGAIPPLMGWCAAVYNQKKDHYQHAFESQSKSLRAQLRHSKEAGAVWLASLLTLWQIPHFNALAYVLRNDYAAGGIKMLAVKSPLWNARFALLCSVLMLPLGIVAEEENMVSVPFGSVITLFNGWITYKSWMFLRAPTNIMVARSLFRVSIAYLPIVLIMVMASRSLHPYWETQYISDARGIREPLNSRFAEMEKKPLIHVTPWYADVAFTPFPFLPLPAPAAAVYETSDRV
eukprot:CAMPEP_0184698930 /NCGR_PEP_ID=MMETSP0313-20130426/5370_1 /TAXON_ID=2792 /ORGANISM="Porphyridium aerugineum, Strain SAG 1380-2" /LENGTH=500 /DNA_ID=CAMNT_0027157931 /DNA_START=361 /DNA_END=1863 /DNA_ORIENTATION=+